MATGERVKATMSLKPAGLMPTALLFREIASVDRQLYEAFDECTSEHMPSFRAKISNAIKIIQARQSKRTGSWKLIRVISYDHH